MVIAVELRSIAQKLNWRIVDKYTENPSTATHDGQQDPKPSFKTSGSSLLDSV